MHRFTNTLRAVAAIALVWAMAPAHAADPWGPGVPDDIEYGDWNIVVVITGL